MHRGVWQCCGAKRWYNWSKELIWIWDLDLYSSACLIESEPCRPFIKFFSFFFLFPSFFFTIQLSDFKLRLPQDSSCSTLLSPFTHQTCRCACVNGATRLEATNHLSIFFHLTNLWHFDTSDKIEYLHLNWPVFFLNEQRCQTVTHKCQKVFHFPHYSYIFFQFPCSFSLALSLSLPSRCQLLSHSAVHTHPPVLFHNHGVVFFLIALCVPLLSPHFFRPVTALMGSDAGRDDSRARFSLWVYYLCSGPFKTTPNGPGSQCGEFVLTSCLSLLTFLLLLRLLLPCYLLRSPCLWEIGRGLWPT